MAQNNVVWYTLHGFKDDKLSFSLRIYFVFEFVIVSTKKQDSGFERFRAFQEKKWDTEGLSRLSTKKLEGIERKLANSKYNRFLLKFLRAIMKDKLSKRIFDVNEDFLV